MFFINEQIVDVIVEKFLMEVMELVKVIEEKFGVFVVVLVVVVVVVGLVVVVEEQIEFVVILKIVGEKKVEVIKVVCVIIGLGLKEVKDLVEVGGVLKDNVLKEEVEKMKKDLEVVGVIVEVK